MKLRPGKLPPELVRRYLGKFTGAPDRSVIVGARLGVDAAVVGVSQRRLVVSCDPITFTTDEIGWYAVQVNANDVAVMGARPRWMLVCLLLPECDAREPERVFRQIDKAARKLGIAIIGGHSEVTTGIDRPLVVATMMGELAGRKPLTAAGARAGDDLVLVKGIAIEGTSIIAREKGAELAQAFPARFLARCRAFLRRPGIGVVEEALLAARHGATAMHDPTEGGLWMAVWEMAEASGTGVEVYGDAVRVYPETGRLAAHYSIDARRLIASGCLLVAVGKRRSAGLMEAYRRRGVEARVIGRLGGRCRVWMSGGSTEEITPVKRDEIAKVLA